MKKIFVILSIFIYVASCLVLPAYSNTKTFSAELSKIETELFGYDYANDSTDNRVGRLEKNIYGKISSGNINSRIKKLSSDIISDKIGQQITPMEDTFQHESLAEADSTVNYPIVDEIEQKLFNQTFKNRDFHTRIVTIERKLFNKIYDVEDYSTRMDRIKTEVMPERLVDNDSFEYNNIENYDNALSSSDLGGTNYNRYSMPYGQRNYTRPYANYGDMTGFSTGSDLSNDLAQLEYDTFGTEFTNEDTNTRIKRLNSANKAKKSSTRYDDNKFQRRMSTAMEIGAMLLMILAMVL